MKRRAKFEHERTSAPLRALTDNQASYIAAVSTSPQVVVLGPAGTGKTFIAATMAADALRQFRTSKVVLTRPNVPSGRSLGFFPGTLEEKISPWVVPFTEVIKDRMGDGAYELAMRRGQIEVVPFEVMRGRTFKDAFVILDEAQNTLPVEMKMFLTRVGNDCRVIINGDISQTDLKETSGLKVALDLIKKHHLPVPIIEFSVNDIVRSDLCALWVKAFHAAKL